MMSTKKTLLTFVTLSSTLLNLSALATPLEKIHFNERWLTHPGQIVAITYGNNHQKLETATCDAYMHSSYTKAGENYSSEHAYFMMKTMKNCKTVKHAEAGFFDLFYLRYIPETIWGSFDIDLEQVAASKDGSYEDNWLAKNKYSTHDHQVIFDNRVSDGTQMGITDLSIQDQTLRYHYQEMNVDKSVIRDVMGTFTTKRIPDPIEE